MKEPLKNGEDLNSRILAAQMFPLRCTRGHRHLNNYLCDRGLSEKFQKKSFFRVLASRPSSSAHRQS
jgi:hypothetical protein